MTSFTPPGDSPRTLPALVLALALASKAMPGIAAQNSIGDWLVDTSTEYAEAYTANDSGSTLGYACIAAGCFYWIDAGTKCSEDSVVPALLNGTEGSSAISLRCAPLQVQSRTRYVGVVQDADAMGSAIEAGGVFSVAIPLQSGEFHVTRFSLEGALGATRSVAAAMTAPDRRTRAKKNLRDSVL